MRILTRAEVEELLTVRDAIDIIRRLFKEMGTSPIDLTLRTSISLQGGRDTVLFMPGYVAPLNNLGMKVVTVFPDNPVHNGHSTISATILLNDSQNGELIALMDGTYITAIRTGAVSAVATDLLAVKEARRLAVFGAGVQAKSQIEALQCVRSIRRVRVFDLNADRASEFVARLQRLDRTGCQFELGASPEAALEDADLVVTATTSKEPVFPGRALKPGAHINAIGSFQPQFRELDDETVRHSRIFVDSRPEALSEAGDLIIPLASGTIRSEAIEASLADLVAGRHHGRNRPDEITLFKSVGLAVEDIAVASYVLEKAQRAQVGLVV